MIIIPPAELFSNELVFSVDNYQDRHLNIITECSYSGTVSLDGSTLSNTGWLQTSDGTYCVLQQSLSAGPHHIEIDNPDGSLLAVLYAFAHSAGYGHVAGFNLSKYHFKKEKLCVFPFFFIFISFFCIVFLCGVFRNANVIDIAQCLYNKQ